MHQSVQTCSAPFRGSPQEVLLVPGERLAKGFVQFVVLHPKVVTVSQSVK